MMLRGAANHRQPILPQLLHGMRQVMLSAALVRLFQPPSLLEQAALRPAMAGHIADSEAPKSAMPIHRLLVYYV
jgi:hypothetical protein